MVLLSNGYAGKQINDLSALDPQRIYFCHICIDIINKDFKQMRSERQAYNQELKTYFDLSLKEGQI